MSACSCETGMLFWKKPCTRNADSACENCQRPLCFMHARREGPGQFLCAECASANESTAGAGADVDSDSSTGSSWKWPWSSSESGSDSGSTWHGADSGGGSSDAGGGGSDGSSGE